MGCSVSVEYHFDRVEMRNGRRCAVVSWGSQPVTTPDNQGGRHEFRAWGTSVMDLDEGCLVEARSVTRSKHFGVGWETDSIAQLDLSL